MIRLTKKIKNLKKYLTNKNKEPIIKITKAKSNLKFKQKRQKIKKNS